jgi:hypothetical protein
MKSVSLYCSRRGGEIALEHKGLVWIKDEGKPLKVAMVTNDRDLFGSTANKTRKLGYKKAMA